MAGVQRHSPGCTCCNCPVQLCVHVKCGTTSGPAIGAASITVKDSLGSTVGTCTGNAAGACCVVLTTAGTYTVEATKDGYEIDSTSITIACNQQRSVVLVGRKTEFAFRFLPSGCCNIELDVEITDGDTTGTATLDPFGGGYILEGLAAPGDGETTTITVTVTTDSPVYVSPQVFTFDVTGPICDDPFGLGVYGNGEMEIAPEYFKLVSTAMGPRCFPRELHYTDPTGSGTLTWTAPAVPPSPCGLPGLTFEGGGAWQGGHSAGGTTVLYTLFLYQFGGSVYWVLHKQCAYPCGYTTDTICALAGLPYPGVPYDNECGDDPIDLAFNYGELSTYGCGVSPCGGGTTVTS